MTSWPGTRTARSAPSGLWREVHAGPLRTRVTSFLPGAPDLHLHLARRTRRVLELPAVMVLARGWHPSLAFSCHALHVALGSTELCLPLSFSGAALDLAASLCSARRPWKESLGSAGASTLGAGRRSWAPRRSEGTPNAISILTHRTEKRCNRLSSFT